MTMKNYIKYISQGMATLLLGSYCEASLIEDLNEANVAFKALNDTPDNWKTVAQQFIKIYDTLNGELGKVEADNKISVHSYASFIDFTAWKDNKVARNGDIVWASFLDSNIANEIVNKYRYPYQRIREGVKFFKKHLEKPLKNKIVECLVERNIKHKKLKVAGERWENDFMLPVGQLLIDYLKEMDTDAETLQLLLDLHRCYFLSDKIKKNENFQKISREFCDSLADTVLKCNKCDEKRNILYAILATERGVKLNGKQYHGSCRYGIRYFDLSDMIQVKMGAEMIQPNECIADAIVQLKARVDKMRNPHQQATIDPEAERLRREVHSQIMNADLYK